MNRKLTYVALVYLFKKLLIGSGGKIIALQYWKLTVASSPRDENYQKESQIYKL